MTAETLRSEIRASGSMTGTGLPWEYGWQLPDRIHNVLFDGQQARTVQQVLAHLRGNFQPDIELSSSRKMVTKEFLGFSPAVTFSSIGPRQMVVDRVFNHPPFDHQATVVMFGNSACATDSAIVNEFRAGRREDVAGIPTLHEGWGVVESVGGDVSPHLHHRIVIMESHASGDHTIRQGDNLVSHTDSYGLCAPLGCDAIVGGITPRVGRGKYGEPIFTYHLPGYGSNVATVEASAIGYVVKDERILTFFGDLSRCESLGNLWRIINGLKERGYKGEGNKNVMVIMGLGATGLPLAIIANHYGFPVIGIEQSEWRRETAKELGVCDAVFENAAEAMQYMGSNGKYADTSSVIVPVMAGSQEVYSDAYALIQDRVTHFPPQDRNSLPHLIVAFGLLSNPDAKLELPGIPQDIGEREIVLRRHEYPLLGGLAKLVGMCGRLPIDWDEMMDALAPAANGDPKNPDLIRMFNAITHTLYTAGQMQPIVDLLNDPAKIQQILEQNHAVKLAFSHFPAGPSGLPLVV